MVLIVVQNSHVLSPKPHEFSSFYVDVFFAGVIFFKILFSIGSLSKKVILEVIFHAIQKLEAYTVLDMQTVFKVVDIVHATKKMGIKVDWIDSILREISTKGIIMRCYSITAELHQGDVEIDRGCQASLREA